MTTRAVTNLILNHGGCTPATSLAVMICAGPLLNMPQESRNTRSMLAFNVKYCSRELYAASTLSARPLPTAGPRPSSRRPLDQRDRPYLPPSIGHAAPEPRATFPPRGRIRQKTFSIDTRKCASAATWT